MLKEGRYVAAGSLLKRYFGEGVQDAGISYFYTRDHLGSVRELTDAFDAVRARYDYDPWGRRTKVSGDKDADFGYTGHYQHTPSGLTLAPMRAYDPGFGRWISEDPAGLAGGVARFAYVDNRPILQLDPQGEFPILLPLLPVIVDAAIEATVWTVAAVEAGHVGQKVLEYRKKSAEQKAEEQRQNEANQREYEHQLNERQKALDEVDRLQRLLDTAKRRNTRERLQDDIDSLLDDVKGHEQKIRDRFGKRCE